MSFSEAVKTCMTKKYAKISGRATRAEFWWFVLLRWLILITLSFVLAFAIGYLKATGTIDRNDTPIIILVISFCILYIFFAIPYFCVLIRRFHDVGYSGWWLLLLFIPYISLAIYVVAILESDGDNKYGPKPVKRSGTVANLSVETEKSSKEEQTSRIDVDLFS
mgnify:CR=1 FL=1